MPGMRHVRNRSNPMKWFRLLPLPAFFLSLALADDHPAAQPLKRSDVVFMGASDKSYYEAYGATVIDWGGHAWSDQEKPRAEFRERVKLAHDLGVQYNAGIGMLTEFAGMIKSCPEYERAVCRTLDGKPVTVPWLWDQKVDGQTGKNYWFCSNSPFYQKYLRELTTRAMIAEPDGYHIDDFAGTTGAIWNGGCFCESCMPLFRDYLKEHIAPEKLRALGIETLDGFDYGKWLLAGHVKDAAEFMKKRYSLPLFAEYQEFQALADGRVVRELQEHAATLRGKPLARSVNGTPPGAQAFVVRPHVDHYSCEIGMGVPGNEWGDVSTKGMTTSAAFVYKCADMAGRTISCTASGMSFAYVCEKNAIHLCRYWVAESYAFGHCFMTPSRHQWCYTKDKGTHWYHAKPGDFADLYQFVRKNAALFDGYEPVAQVGVIFSHTAWRKNKKDPQVAANVLLEANVPFALVAAGDALLDLRLEPARLAAFEKIAVPAEPMLDAGQQKTLDQATTSKTVIGKDAKTILDGITPCVAVENAKNVWALPRRIPNRADAPLVVHLLNRNHDFAADRPVPQQDVVLRLRPSLLGGKRPAHCTALTAGSEPMSLAVESDGDGVRVKIPELKLWTVLRLD
jgi:hypothetical protein